MFHNNDSELQSFQSDLEVKSRESKCHSILSWYSCDRVYLKQSKVYFDNLHVVFPFCIDNSCILDSWKNMFLTE